MNPFDALATFVLGKIKEGLYAQWLRFLFELGFSAVVSFLFICGVMLTGNNDIEISIGSGMVTAAIMMTYLFRKERSKLTAGMIIALPSTEAAKELETNIQIIEKSKETKV